MGSVQPLMGSVVAAVALIASSSSAPAVRATATSAPGPREILWEEPTDLAVRDLYHGPWGPEWAPNPHARYELIELKHSGVNPGMTVRDPLDRRWSVKQPPYDGTASEGPIEVVLSRVISAIGYRQPPVYYLPSFTLVDDWGARPQPGGRFRPKDKRLKEVGEWSWQRNPFVGTTPYQGLLVVLLIFASSDLKDSNNSIFEYRSHEGLERWYVVRDLGTALGDTSRFAPRRGDPDVFERRQVFKGIKNGFVEFNYHAAHQELVRGRIRPDAVAWATDLLGRLSERQWTDAFRAGGYSDPVAERFITKLRSNIAEGRALAATAGARPEASGSIHRY